MQSPTQKKPGAMLYALTNPHPDISDTEFNTWYDTDHSPGRAACPGFQRVARFLETDEHKPAFLDVHAKDTPRPPPWLAMYELDGLSALQSEAYKMLWTSTTDDEKKYLGALDRRVYTLISEKVAETYDEYCASGQSRALTHNGLQPPSSSKDLTEEEFHRWYEEEHVPMLSRCPQWLRSTRWELVDAKGVAGEEVSDGGREKIPKFLALHEWTSNEVYTTREMEEAVTTPWRMSVIGRIDKKAEERRMFKLWKQF